HTADSQTHKHMSTHTHTHTHTQTHKKTNKADCSQFFIARTTHSNTHVLYIYGGNQDTLHTHTRARRPEVAVNFCSAFFPSRDVLPPGPPRSSGQLLSARGPSEPSVSVREIGR